MITFAIHVWDGPAARGWDALKDEFERRGVPCRVVRSPKTETRTPHQDRARRMVDALGDVEGDVGLLGISNEGLYMPLVAAARPVRRIVMVNAVIPFPGKSFLEGSKGQRVFRNPIAGLAARRAPGMSEVCPLTELPAVEWVYLSAENDEAVRPEWEQWAAREYLHVEPVVVKGAGHAEILKHTGEVVDAATAGLVTV
jgi:hypothetical protein